MKARSYVIVFAVVAAASAAQAAPTRIRGTIAAVNGDTLTINSRDGKTITLKLAAGYTVGAVKKATLADIKPSEFVGATTVPRKDGMLVALEVHIFPPGRRPGEGSKPYDLAPQSMMTNADVTGDVQSAQGRKLTLTYKGGEKTFIVTTKTPIVFNVSGTPADVKPGVGIVVNAATKNSDGSFETKRITVGIGGISPPD